MANRATLHKLKLDEFIEWLDKVGIAHRPGKGTWQVLQVKTDQGWSPIFENIRADHLTIQNKLTGIVRRFIRNA